MRQKAEEKEEDHFVKLRLSEIAPRSVMSGYLALRVCVFNFIILFIFCLFVCFVLFCFVLFCFVLFCFIRVGYCYFQK